MIVHMPFESTVSFLPSDSPGHKNCWFSKLDIMGARLPGVASLGYEPDVGLRPLVPQGRRLQL